MDKVNYWHCTACFSLERVGGLIGRMILLLVLRDELELTSVTQVTTGIKQRKDLEVHAERKQAC